MESEGEEEPTKKKKKKKKKIIIMLGFLVMHPKYCDRMAKTLIRLDLQVFLR